MQHIEIHCCTCDERVKNKNTFHATYHHMLNANNGSRRILSFDTYDAFVGSKSLSSTLLTLLILYNSKRNIQTKHSLVCNTMSSANAYKLHGTWEPTITSQDTNVAVVGKRHRSAYISLSRSYNRYSFLILESMVGLVPIYIH